MLPVTDWYGCRYHPFSRSLALHTLFPVEQPICPLHSLYTIYPTNSDASLIDPPQPLSPKATKKNLTAAEYFNMQERQYPNKIYEKPKGEVAHPKQNGYTLMAALKWPTEVYKEVQVGYLSHSILSSIMVRPICISSLAKSYPWLCSCNRHLGIWMPSIRTYATLFFNVLESSHFGLTDSWYLSIPVELCSKLGHCRFPLHVSQEQSQGCQVQTRMCKYVS